MGRPRRSDPAGPFPCGFGKRFVRWFGIRSEAGHSSLAGPENCRSGAPFSLQDEYTDRGNLL